MKATIKLLPILVALVVCLAFSGCGDTNNYTSIKPSNDILVGAFQMTAESATVFAGFGYIQTNACIKFYSTGKFEMENMPGCWLQCGGVEKEGRHSYDSIEGNWQLVDDGVLGAHIWAISFHFTNTDKIISIPDLKSKNDLGERRARLKNAGDGYFLHFVVGDPDSSPLLEFAKHTTESFP